MNTLMTNQLKMSEKQGMK